MEGASASRRRSTGDAAAATDRGRATDAAASDGRDIRRAKRQPAQTGSAELVLLGVLGGVYLLYTLGWFLSALRVPNSASVSSHLMFALGLWLAVLAPALWFGVTFWLAGRARARLVWLIVGALVLVPIAIRAGGDA